MDKKMYSIRVIPTIIMVNDPDNEGAKKKVIKYVLKSKPDEKAKEKGFKPTKYVHLQLFEEDKDSFLGGDTKPSTLNVFENVDPVLFDKLTSLVEDEDKHEILATDKAVMILGEKLPGLVVNKPCAPYYATYRNKTTGKMEKLTQNSRNSAGDFTSDPVVLESLSFFLFANKVNPDDEAIQFVKEKNRISTWVKGASDDTVATVTAEVEEGKTEGTE